MNRELVLTTIRSLSMGLALGCASVGVSLPAAWAAEGAPSSAECLQAALENLEGARFLHQRDSKFHTSPPVEPMQAKLQALGERKFQEPSRKISAYLSERRKVFEEARDRKFV